MVGRAFEAGVDVVNVVGGGPGEAVFETAAATKVDADPVAQTHDGHHGFLRAASTRFTAASLAPGLNWRAAAGTLWAMSSAGRPDPATSRNALARIVPRLALAAALVAPAVAGAQSPASRAVNGPAISMYGDLKYGPGFKHFDYANPDAVKGGDVKMAAFGTYDTLNPFTLKGVAAAGLGETFDSLMVGSADEPFSYYCLVAETVETPADRSWEIGRAHV